MNANQTLELIRAYHLQNAQKYGLREIGIFGSVARNSARADSDIDIVVDLESSDYSVLARIKNELETLLGGRVDIVRKRKNMNRLLRQRIDKEAVYV